MMKRIFLVAAIFLACAPSFAQQNINIGTDADALINSYMGQNALFDVTNAYLNMLEYLYPERATLAGIDRANGTLDERTLKAEQARRSQITEIKDMLSKISRRKLAQSEKTDYDILSRSLDFDYYLVSRNRVQTSPLFYLAAQDAVYDVMLKRINTINQYENIEPRLKALPQVYRDAATNLKGAYKAENALALNKAYAAFTSLGDMDGFLKKNSGNDERAALKVITDDTKAAMRQFFDKLKKIAKTAKPEPQKSPSYYEMALKNQIQIDDSTSELTKLADAALTKAKGNLLVMVKAYNLGKTPEVKDFYAIAAKVQGSPAYERLLQTVGDEIKKANAAMANVLPGSDMKVFVNHMPLFPAFLNPAFLFLPPYGTEHNLVGTLFIYTPPTKTGNPRAELNAYIQKHFTIPQIKLLVTENVVPGRQMFYSYSYDTKPIRRILGSNAVLDGWSAYAKHLAYEVGYLNTKDDALYLAFDDYARAVKALADLKLGAGTLDYEETVLFIMSQGISKEDAEMFTRQLAFNPGSAIGELRGYTEIKALRKKYKAAQGEAFSLANFHNKIFFVGKVPVGALAAEVENAYKVTKNMDLKNYTPNIGY